MDVTRIGAVVLMCVAGFASGCVSTPRPSQAWPSSANANSLMPAHGTPLPSITDAEKAERQPRRQHSRDVATRADSDSEQKAVAGRRQSAMRTRQAVLDTIANVKASTGSAANALSQLAARPPGLGGRGLSGVNGAFTRYLDFGSKWLPWLHGVLGGATALTHAASEVVDPDMELGMLRMTGSRLQAALFGAMMLAAWRDFLQLADTVLRECPAYSAERLLMDLHRVQGRMEPTLAALASQDPTQVEAASVAMPGLMGQLTHEFGSISEGARVSMERVGRTMAAVQALEMLTLVSALRMSLPRLPPAAPATLGVGLVMGSGGVMVGSRIVVSAEWVEMMRRLVQAGVISVPAVSAAIRIHGGQVLMAQANQDLPKGVRDALGDGPEVRAMRETGKAGAGMSEAPKHHVLPAEHRAWFEQRGFTGELSIDQFCVRLEAADHQAIHGGGHWRLGRTWPGEWNQMIMQALLEAETRAGRTLTRNAILRIVGENMKVYGIPMNFTSGRRR
ncbi:DUF2380 domain-containing protein [Pyxidicoccus xibeiensis]|uniref:DUF2380 domain-containing protein n=1 Tax=Pyxidicoccus xibeiensis TaxID=2906759 RepID=UPI0020A7C5D4|nr:DUF2380 domain-containing protein [Pyxidicoccus xibeiensis]MCP3141680.1 DUF2380 domain-containing protein [Pyxidicoccus xibeiensis]